MGTETGIEWTDHTFNPWIGCTKVSQGCANCYAAARDARHLHGPEDHWGPGAHRKPAKAAYWELPNKWAEMAEAEGKRHKVFTASMADIFDAEAPMLERRRLWKVIERTSVWLDWQIVTKRPERIRTVLNEDRADGRFFNVNRCWLVASTEDQKAADTRIQPLVEVPAAIHGISAEPLLGEINLHALPWYRKDTLFDAITGNLYHTKTGQNVGKQKGLDWIIAGGESGARARRCDPAHVLSLRDQALKTGIAFFFKQWGEWLPPMTEGIQTLNISDDFVKIGKKKSGALLDGQVWHHFPKVAA